MFIYKKNIMKELSKAGYNARVIREKNLLSQATTQRIRHEESITLATINILCMLLKCQPNHLFEIRPSEEEIEKYGL